MPFPRRAALAFVSLRREPRTLDVVHHYRRAGAPGFRAQRHGAAIKIDAAKLLFLRLITLGERNAGHGGQNAALFRETVWRSKFFAVGEAGQCNEKKRRVAEKGT